MLLRSITKHVKDQNWFAVALDFFIVVVGILLAFQITEWNEERAARAIEIEYLTQLRNDLEVIQNEAQRQIIASNKVNTAADVVAKLIELPPSKERQDKLWNGLSGLAGRTSFIIHSPTFEDLQSSGKLSLITDKDLRTKIISDFAKMKRVEFVIEKNNDTYLDSGFISFIRDDIGLPLNPSVNSATDARFFNPRLSNHGRDILMRPSSHEVWDRIVPQMSYRDAIAGANHILATRVLGSATRLEADIDAFLEDTK